MTGRCGTCKHWTRYSADDFRIGYHGSHAGDCSSDKFQYGIQTYNTPIDGLLYWDRKDKGAEFNTGENFGCVHWIAK